MADPVTVVELALPVRGDGSALLLAQGTSTFGLTEVALKGDTPKGATVTWVRDPDNEEDNTIFWVQNPAWSGAPASGTYTLLLSYPAE